MAEYIPKEDLEHANFFLRFCSVIAPFTSIAMFLSPIPTIRNILKTGTVGDLPLAPYTTMVTSTFVWIIYGLIKGEPLIWFTNVVEFILSTYYFVEFTNYAPEASSTFPGSVWSHIYFTLGIWCFTIFTAIVSSNRIVVLGDLTVVLTILTLASPLAAVQAVLQSKSSESIPWPFTLAATGNCVIWTIVGVAELHDAYVYFPEVLGLLFGGIQIALKLTYHQNSHAPASTQRPTYVEMPYPILEKVRQIVMFGNDNSVNPAAVGAPGGAGGTYTAVDVQEGNYDLSLLDESRMTPGSNSEYVVEFSPDNNNTVSAVQSSSSFHAQQSYPPQQFQQQQPLFINEPHDVTNSLPPSFATAPPPQPLSSETVRSRSGNIVSGDDGDGNNTNDSADDAAVPGHYDGDPLMGDKPHGHVS